MSNPGQDLRLTVCAVSAIAKSTHLFELRDAGGAALPAFTAGAHITLRLPGGISRRYSLCNDPAERDRYLIAVRREKSTPRLVESARVGDDVAASAPHNSFELVEAPQ